MLILDAILPQVPMLESNDFVEFGRSHHFSDDALTFRRDDRV